MMQLSIMRPGSLTEAVADLDPETLLADVPAAVLRLPPVMLTTWRCRSLGPRFLRIGQGHKRMTDIVNPEISK